MYRCLNDIFGYCTGEPEVEVGKEVKSGDLTVTEKRCKLDAKTCGKYKFFSQQIDTSKLPEPHLVETITPAKSDKTPKSGKKKAVKEGAKLL